MKVAVFSDLHVECRQPLNVNCDGADVIVLAGDCHARDGINRLAAELRLRYNNTVPVLTVAGNHEFYDGEYHTRLALLRGSAKQLGVHFLECDSVVLDGVRFLGCTLWTNFRLYGDHHQGRLQREAENCIADFWAIRFGGQRFVPSDANTLFEQSYAWLERELAKPFDGKTVVITHFGPHIAAKHHKYAVDDPASAYFISDCTALMQQFSIDLWIYGHTHNSLDVQLESGTRLVSNQRGYPNEDPHYTQFDRHKLCKL